MRGPNSGPLEISRCPVRIVGHDVIELVDAFKLAGERISFAEQEYVPPTYLDAIKCVRYHLELLRRQLDEEARRDSRKKR